MVKTPAIKAAAIGTSTGITSNDSDRSVNRNKLARRVPPMVKILPEAKRSLAEHLKNTNNNSLRCQNNSSSSSQILSNMAVIKPVLKKDNLTNSGVAHRTSSSLASSYSIKQSKSNIASATSTAPITTITTMAAAKTTNRISPIIDKQLNSDDEVQLDYDEDDLLLDEEEMLLATPDCSPKHPSLTTFDSAEIQQQKQQQSEEVHYKLSCTPSPPPPNLLLLKTPVHNIVPGEQLSLGVTETSSVIRNVSSKDNIVSGSENKSVGLGSSNRRVILRSSIDSFKTTSTLIISGSRGNNGNGNGNKNNDTKLQQSSIRKGIFDRLEGRTSSGSKHLSCANNGKGNDGASSTISVESDYRRKSQRIVLKHNWD